MNWSASEIRRVDAESSGELWERFLTAMVAYWNESFPSELSHLEWHELYTDRIRRRLEERPTWLWMYQRDGRTLALTNFHLDGGVAHVAEVWVAPDSRRHGLGAFMIRQMRRTLREAGVTRMAVTVPTNATVAASSDFWRDLGFTEVAVHLEATTFGPNGD